MWTTVEPSENQKPIDEFHPSQKTLFKYSEFAVNFPKKNQLEYFDFY